MNETKSIFTALKEQLLSLENEKRKNGETEIYGSMILRKGSWFGHYSKNKDYIMTGVFGEQNIDEENILNILDKSSASDSIEIIVYDLIEDNEKCYYYYDDCNNNLIDGKMILSGYTSEKELVYIHLDSSSMKECDTCDGNTSSWGQLFYSRDIEKLLRMMFVEEQAKLLLEIILKKSSNIIIQGERHKWQFEKINRYMKKHIPYYAEYSDNDTETETDTDTDENNTIV